MNVEPKYKYISMNHSLAQTEFPKVYFVTLFRNSYRRFHNCILFICYSSKKNGSFIQSYKFIAMPATVLLHRYELQELQASTLTNVHYLLTPRLYGVPLQGPLPSAPVSQSGRRSSLVAQRTQLGLHGDVPDSQHPAAVHAAL